MQKSESELEASAIKAAGIEVSVTMNCAQWSAVIAACTMADKYFKRGGYNGTAFATLGEVVALMQNQILGK